MIVSFFEEYPTEKNLSKLKLIKFPTKLYIAAESIDAFYKIKDKIKARNVKYVIYWPLLKKEEGYWMSPFSDSKALKRVMEEAKDVVLLWDAELPFRRSLLLKNLIYFRKNKKLIKEFFIKHKKEVYCAESFPEKGLLYKLLKFLGIEFNSIECGGYEVKMLYSSMHGFSKDFIKKEIEEGKAASGDKFIPAFGVLAKGAKGDENIISKAILERDLRIAKQAGVKEVIVFRLGGITKEYAGILKKYSK
ncbi:MAG: hypothetical protein KJ955_07560 [Nanoarchaeota archaeon]|nr:hypothetical protein [Nanoarchaeota archaeon]